MICYVVSLFLQVKSDVLHVCVRADGGLHIVEEQHKPGRTERLLDCTETARTTGACVLCCPCVWERKECGEGCVYGDISLRFCLAFCFALDSPFLVILHRHAVNPIKRNLWRQVPIVCLFLFWLVCLCVSVCVCACVCVCFMCVVVVLFSGGISLIGRLIIYLFVYFAVDRPRSEPGHHRPTISIR